MSLADDIQRARASGPERVIGTFISYRGSSVPVVSANHSEGYTLESGGRSVDIAGQLSIRQNALNEKPRLGEFFTYKGKKCSIKTIDPDNIDSVWVVGYIEHGKGA